MTRNEKMTALLQKDAYTAADLITIVEILRLPGGCPWDREQTHKSIRNDLIEETYEVIEAIDNDDPELLCEELGDVLLQVVMHARMEEEAGRADFDGIADGICKKLIHRHPHVFGTVQVRDSAEVLSNWDQIKSEEKSRLTRTDKLRAIPRQLPALMRAAKVGKKSDVLDFPDVETALDKTHEELTEVDEALAAGNPEAVTEEIGDLLFAAANLARKAGVDPEKALTDATDKYIVRFASVEAQAAENGRDMADMTPAELDILWKNAKKLTKNAKNG